MVQLPSGWILITENIKTLKMNSTLLAEGFFDHDVLQVARELLGMSLCVKSTNGQITRSTICETEAYDGQNDLACHASKGKTKRTSVMFEKGGVWYIYLCYGMHWMLNLVTGPEDYPAAVLLRGVVGLSGPGRLTKGLRINKSFNGLPVSEASSLWIEKSLFTPKNIYQGPRIGVNYAGPVWSTKPYRFWFSSE